MCARRLTLCLVGVMLAVAQTALAEEVAVAWQSDPRQAHWVAVNTSDDSCWVSYTFSSSDSGEVVHLAEDGGVLARAGDFDWWAGGCISVNPTDGSCWVSSCPEVAHVAEDGTELWRGFATYGAHFLSTNWSDGSCWIGGCDEVVHLAEDGTELLRVEMGGDYPDFRDVSVDQIDGSCWVVDTLNNEVLRLAEDGAELWRGGSLAAPARLSANPADGSCWVVDSSNGEVLHLARDGRLQLTHGRLGERGGWVLLAGRQGARRACASGGGRHGAASSWGVRPRHLCFRQSQ